MALSYTARLGSQSGQFTGSKATSASLSTSTCVEHVDRLIEMVNCVSFCCALITCFTESVFSHCLDGEQGVK